MKTILAIFTIFCTTFITAQTIKENDLKYALSSDNVENFQKLVTPKTKTDCFKIGNSSYSLLALTIKTGAKNCFDYLLTQKIDVEKACAGKTPLMYAVKYNNLNMVKALIKAGANTKAKTGSGRTALDYAKKYKRQEIATYLESL